MAAKHRLSPTHIRLIAKKSERRPRAHPGARQDRASPSGGLNLPASAGEATRGSLRRLELERKIRVLEAMVTRALRGGPSVADSVGDWPTSTITISDKVIEIFERLKTL